MRVNLREKQFAGKITTLLISFADTQVAVFWDMNKGQYFIYLIKCATAVKDWIQNPFIDETGTSSHVRVDTLMRGIVHLFRTSLREERMEFSEYDVGELLSYDKGVNFLTAGEINNPCMYDDVATFGLDPRSISGI